MTLNVTQRAMGSTLHYDRTIECTVLQVTVKGRYTP